MEKKPAWNNTCNRFVAFLDIMGFRDRVFRESHEDMMEMFVSLRPTIKTIETFAKVASRSKKIAIVKPIIFSDSIILVSNDDSKNAFEWILFDSQWILYNAILQGIPIKGAIAYGKQTADFKESLHFGKPLIDAYELQNELKLYGVVLHHTVEKSLNEFKVIDSFLDTSVIKMLVPMKSGKITHYIVNWTQITTNKHFEPIDLVTQLYNNVSGSPRKYVDNTMEFVRWVTEKKTEIKQGNKKINKV